MSNKQKRTSLSLLAVVGLGLAVFSFASTRSRLKRPQDSALANQQSTPSQTGLKHRSRNLSLQPEAFNMARRLGRRFAPTTKEQSVLIGSLTMGGERHTVQIVRKQRDDGEEVEINLSGLDRQLSWAGDQGAMTLMGRASGNDRELIERLVLDSPDQFVLAQLRGASYYTVARNVRPVDVDESYAGPLWNIVRVGDPQRDDEKRPQSSWRLYYVNARTGLIEKIVSQLQGRTIEAEISGWSDVNGEQVPSAITWTSQGQTLMQFRLTNFSHDRQ